MQLLDQLPNLIAIDTETYDPFLEKLGPGFINRKDAHIIGFSVASSVDNSFYIPLRHITGNVGNQASCISWLQSICSDSDRSIVFANAKYDLEVLWSIGIEVKAKIIDIQTQDALIDENQTSYSLASIAKRRELGEKLSDSVNNMLLDKGFVKRGKADWSKLAQLDPATFGPYACQDAVLTYKANLQQQVEIEKLGLRRVADLESELHPILFKMKLQGVRTDTDKAEQINKSLGLDLEKSLLELQEESGVLIDPWSPRQMGEWVKKLGFNPPITTKDNDSVTAEWLMALGHPLCIKMANYKKGEKVRRDFIEGVILEQSHNGRIHPNWFTTRGSSFMSGDDVSGTRSGRLACTDPNLAQIPARHKVYGPLVRGCFIPEAGCQWGKFDYSSQEPRITVHYAKELGLDGAHEVWQAYQDNPKTDLHQLVADIMSVERSLAKTINLGIIYGEGKAKLGRQLNLPQPEVTMLFEKYHRLVPFMKPLLKRVMEKAERTGYVKTILGRRRNYTEWENGEFGDPWSPPVKDYTEAVKKWGKVKRSKTYKSLNSIVQGSAAEQMKTAIVRLYKEWDFLPIVTVYDELGINIDQPDFQIPIVREIMENAIQFHVPHVVDVKLGDNWSAK